MNNTTTFDQALQEWLTRAQKIVTDNHTNMKYTNFAPSTLSIDPNGKKYIKIVRTDFSDSRSVHCFIEKATGDVLKAAGWNAPAKHARGNIYRLGQEGVGPYGGNYLI
jgi:hypothetical protein